MERQDNMLNGVSIAKAFYCGSGHVERVSRGYLALERRCANDE